MSEQITDTRQVAEPSPALERLPDSRVVCTAFPTNTGGSIWIDGFTDNAGRFTYFFPEPNSDDDPLSYGSQRLKAMQRAGIPLRLKAGETNRFEPKDRKYARTVLRQDPFTLKYPHAEQTGSEALVVRRNPVAILDLMIRAGHDSSDIRQARIAAAHGRPNHTASSLSVALEAAALEDVLYEEEVPIAQKRRSEVYKACFEGTVTGVRDLLLSAVKKGVDFAAMHRAERLLQHGFRPDIVETLAQDPEKSKRLFTEVWADAIERARRHNTDRHNEGVYVELYKYCGGVLPLPAIASTAYDVHDSGIGWVGSGHTLAQIYVEGGGRRLPEHASKDAEIFDTKAAEASKALGLGEMSAAKLLQRRARVFFDKAGVPVIELPPETGYENGRGKMTNAQLQDALLEMGIASRIKRGDPVALTRSPELWIEPNSIVVRDVELSLEARGSAGYWQAVLVPDAENGGFMWACGESKAHSKLREELKLPEEGVIVNVDGEDVAIVGQYMGYDDRQAVLWQIAVTRGEFEKHKPAFTALISDSATALSRHMAGRFLLPETVEHMIIFSREGNSRAEEVTLTQRVKQ